MKYIAILSALAVAVMAQDINTVPECARTCISDATEGSTSCGTDYKCACQSDNFNKIQGAAAGCVVNACGQDKALQEVLPAVKKFCGQ